MKKIIGLLSILLVLSLVVPPEPALANRGQVDTGMAGSGPD